MATNTTAPGIAFAPSTVGPVTFNAPGTTGPRFTTGTVNSTNLLTAPIESDLYGVQTGPLVTFAIVVENEGAGPYGAYDVDVQNNLPAGLEVPTAGAGLNLQVFDGSGATINYTSLTGGLFGSGIQLTDPSTTVPTPNGGALETNDPMNGHNIAVITFDLQVIGTIQPDQAMISTATQFLNRYGKSI